VDIIGMILLQLYFQVCVIGYIPILKKKLLKEFAYSKIIKFYISLFVITIFFGIFVIYKCKKKVDIIESGKKIKSKTIIDEILNFYVNYFYIFYL
jgi:hypothetical protein